MVIRATNKVVTNVSSASPLMPQCWMVLGLNTLLLRLHGIGSKTPNHSDRSHPQSRLALIHNLGLISSTIDQISSTISARSHPQYWRDLIQNQARSHTTSTRSHPQSVRSLPQPRLDLILYSAKSHPRQARSHPQSVRFHPPPQLDLINTRLHLIHTRLHIIHNLGQISSSNRLHLIYNRLDLIRSG